MRRNNRTRKIVSALVTVGLSLCVVTVAQSKADTSTVSRQIDINERLRVAKPVAGRNRRRSQATSRPAYPKANNDRVRVSRQLNKLHINVLSNDDGYKLRVVNINARSAGGARVSVRNGMAVYQMPKHFLGKDSFWYTLEDKSGRQHSAQVVVCICEE